MFFIWYSKIYKLPQDVNENNESKVANPTPLINSVEERDRKVLNDPLFPPDRRVNSKYYNQLEARGLINYPTQGYGDSFQYMGNVSRKSDETILQLFGRQKYRNSDKYEYYVLNKESGIKSPIDVKNDGELFDEDEVNVSLYDTSKGTFTVYLNKINNPSYFGY